MEETYDEGQVVMHQCRHDMMALWNDRTVREILKRRKIRLEESPGLYAFTVVVSLQNNSLFFANSYLDDLERVTSLRYLPSDGDSGRVISTFATLY